MPEALALLQEVSARSSVVATWLTYVEDGIYLVTAALLGATAVVLIGATARDLVRSSTPMPMMQRALKALDSLLLVLMIVELLHTIRLFIVGHALVPEPFLVVALIAGVRRVLILTTEASQYIQTQPEQFRMALREMSLLMVSFLVLAVSIVVLQRFPLAR
ncbi:MAG TPA: phosphate-starvation-inducible PsiE family protein [Gemmatimonadales bacterium]|nr:phosphate-starvation-inducible PsiE family protein [Gemmatimonadales bacterium]